MKECKVTMTILVVFVLLFACSGYSQPLQGTVGYSTQYFSGWLDLKSLINFKQGDVLKLRLGGSATKVVVRLLSKDSDANLPSGIDGGIVEVPKSKTIQILLEEDHDKVIQISVHGGPNPWNLYPLGGGNGAVTLRSAERIVSKK